MGETPKHLTQYFKEYCFEDPEKKKMLLVALVATLFSMLTFAVVLAGIVALSIKYFVESMRTTDSAMVGLGGHFIKAQSKGADVATDRSTDNRAA